MDEGTKMTKPQPLLRGWLIALGMLRDPPGPLVSMSPEMMHVKSEAGLKKEQGR